jgi:3-deoxy-D-manno-octulosonic acid kinase
MRSSNIIETKYQDWVIGSNDPIRPEQIKKLIRLTDQNTSTQTTPLAGRSAVLKKEIKGIGPVVIKQYVRGGMMQWLLKDRYFKTGHNRALAEFEILLKAAEYGINVPEPVLCFQKGHRIYKCWLVTKEIPSEGSIAQISLTNPESLRALMAGVTLQVQKMITKGIYHVDFHPGNVLAGRNGKIYLLDFDKAGITKMEKTTLAQKYINRWNRAVLKHNLPGILLEKFIFQLTD